MQSHQPNRPTNAKSYSNTFIFQSNYRFYSEITSKSLHQPSPILLTQMKLSVLALLGAALAKPLGERTLVVRDSEGASLDESSVVDPLTARGHAVTLKSVRDGTELYDNGQRAWDNLVLIPGRTKGLGKSLSTRSLLGFLEDGGNIAVLTTPESSPLSIREAAAQFGLIIGSKGVTLVDYFDGKPKDEAPQIVSYGDIKVNNTAPARIQGSDPLLIPVLRAPSSAYAVNLLEQVGDARSDNFALGSDIVSAAALQTRHNARFSWVGSPELLTDELLKWTFQEKGVLRAIDVVHFDETETEHHVYKVNEELGYCATIQEYDGEDWKPYIAGDLQLEFRMLDPYYRLNLTKTPTKPGQYCTKFKIPDQYGMFTFALDYFRPGKSFISDHRTVTIRHTANGEWARSWTITNSWVYLSSAISVVGGFILFVAIYLSSSQHEVVKPQVLKPQVQSPVVEKHEEPKKKISKKQK